MIVVHEGSEILMDNILIRKQCKCSVSASGPRYVHHRGNTDKDGVIHFDCYWVSLACDLCDTPWLGGVGPGTVS